MPGTFTKAAQSRSENRITSMANKVPNLNSQLTAPIEEAYEAAGKLNWCCLTSSTVLNSISFLVAIPSQHYF